MSAIHVQVPASLEELGALRCGQSVLLSGVIYTARDAAHARLCAALDAGEPPPVDLRGQMIFYAGPTPPEPGMSTGAIGPTTSGRMDAYTPQLLAYGIAAMIGKGDRNLEVQNAIVRHGAVYFAAIGGCAAYMAACVTNCEVVAYDDLGTESIKKLTVKDLPVTVAIDSKGNNAYEQGMRAYAELAQGLET